VISSNPNENIVIAILSISMACPIRKVNGLGYEIMSIDVIVLATLGNFSYSEIVVK